MIPLRNKTNAIPPASPFNSGDLKDNPGDGTGVPVDRNLLDDQAQFFESLMEIGELLTSNFNIGLGIISSWVAGFTGRNYTSPQIDNGNTVYQLISAFFFAIGARVQMFIATQGQVNTGTDNVNYVTSLTLKTNLALPLIWTSVTYASGWGDTGGQVLFKYSKNALNEVLLRGEPSNASVPSPLPQVIANLPIGFRPATTVKKTIFLQDATNGTSFVGNMIIGTTGDIAISAVSGFTANNGLFVIGLDTSFPTV